MASGSRRRRRLAALLAALAVGAGATLAAVTAAQPAHHRGRTSELSAAASYLGINETQLRSQLRSGRSLAQIASSTPGRSTAGLIEAVVATRKAHLESELANLKAHVTSQVDRGRSPGRGAAASIVARYLGLDRRALVAKLRSGMSLGQIADSTPGRTRAGLIAVLETARTSALDARVAAGKLTRAQAQARIARLPQRISRLVDRVGAPFGAHRRRTSAGLRRGQSPTPRIPSGS